MAAYEVATIKPADPAKPWLGTTLRRYTQSAYGAGALWGGIASQVPLVQVVGGPVWIDKDTYQITGKAPDELRVAMQAMPPEEKTRQMEMMQQSLLAERFHLKAHFETREMTVYELVPAKGGLKIKPVDPPPARGPAFSPGSFPMQVSPGMIRLGVNNQGVRVVDARATTMAALINLLRGQADVGGRPIVDRTGFTGNFDVTGLRFSGQPIGPESDQRIGDSDAPAISTSLEETLGLKLVTTKASVEIVVVDSIDRPSEN